MNGERPNLLEVLKSIALILYNNKRNQFLLALRAIVIILLAVIFLTLYSVWKVPDTWISVVQTVQDLATTLAILVGGIWAFYVFILGRSFSGVIRIELKPKQLTKDVIDECVVISVKLKNVGRTHVDKRQCMIGIEPISKVQLLTQPELKPITNTMSARHAQWRPIFGEVLEGFGGILEKLEPDEETEANVLLPIGKTPAVKVAVMFVGVAGPSFLPRKWRRAETEGWRKEIVDKVDEWREEPWVTRTIIDTESHIMDIKMAE